MPSLFTVGVLVNRGLIGFLMFLAVILLGFAAFAYELGPTALAFVFHPERRTAPVVMVNFFEYAGADAEQRYREVFGNPSRPMIEAVGGHRVWSARAGDVVSGRLRDGWSWLELVAYPSRAAVIELVTSSEYRALRAARGETLQRSAVLAATPEAPFADDGTNAHAVRLLAGAHRDSIATYQAQWSNQDETLLARYHGRVVWRAHVDPIVGEASQHFDEMLIYGFPDVDQRDAWMNDPERATLQTLQQGLFRRDVLLLAKADADAP
jgi:uncharacterized protein (DUF1330 family)